MPRKNFIALSLALIAILLIFLLVQSHHSAIEQAPPKKEQRVSKTPSAKKSPPSNSLIKENLLNLLKPVHDSIRPHPLMLEGQLDNGLKYKILNIPSPSRQISLRLVIEAGSLMEEEHERGIAHFLEHLAFNGTTNFPEGRAMEEFQRLGLKPAQHANASTSYQHTIYKLDLPDDSEEGLESSLHFFRDIFDGLLLKKDEIELERPIILQEKQQRGKKENGFDFIIPNSLLAKRSPIGLRKTILNFTQQDFLNFHQKWYTPNRGTLILCGDIDPEKTESLIRERFGSLPWQERAADPQLGAFTPEAILVSNIQTEKTHQVFTLKTVTSALPPPNHPENLRTHLIDQLTHKMLTSRWRKISEEHPQLKLTPYSNAYDIFGFARLNRFHLLISSGTFHFEQFLTEWHRLLQHGFLSSELHLSRKDTLLLYSKEAEKLTTQSAATHADQIVSASRSGGTYTSPLDDLARVQATLPQIQLDDCLHHLRSLWNQQATLIQTSSKEGQTPPADPVSRFLNFQAQSFPKLTEPTYPRFSRPPKGKSNPITSREDFPELKLTKITLANGLKINLRPSPNHSKLVHLRLTFGRGAHSIPPQRPGLEILTNYVFQQSGIRGLSRRKLKGSLQHQFVHWDFELHLDHHLLTGLCTRSNLLTQCQVLHALLTEASWISDHPFDLSHTSPQYLNDYLNSRIKTPKNYWRVYIDEFITNSDSRFSVPTSDDLFHTRNNELQTWLSEDLYNNPLELTITGDFIIEEALQSIHATFAKLPLRASQFPPLKNNLAIFEALPSEIRTIDPPGNKAYVSYFFHTPQALFSLERKIHLILLKEVLQSRVRSTLREQLGLAYSPRVLLQTEDNLGDLNYLLALIPTGAQNIPAVTEAMTEVINSFQNHPISEDEVERARRPLLKWKPLTNASPSYWAETLKQASRQPYLIDDLKTIEEAYKLTTPTDLQDLALQIITSGACEFTVTQ